MSYIIAIFLFYLALVFITYGIKRHMILSRKRRDQERKDARIRAKEYKLMTKRQQEYERQQSLIAKNPYQSVMQQQMMQDENYRRWTEMNNLSTQYQSYVGSMNATAQSYPISFVHGLESLAERHNGRITSMRGGDE